MHKYRGCTQDQGWSKYADHFSGHATRILFLVCCNFRIVDVAVHADVTLYSHMSAHFLTFPLTFTHQLSQSASQ